MSRLTDLERSLTQAAERLDQQEAGQQARRPVKHWTWRLPLLATIGTLALGGGAVAALDLLPEGDPVPEATDAQRFDTIKGSDEVLQTRAPDPEGGPAWGIWVYRERGPGGRGELECFVPGRVQDDEIGVVGRDGLFNNDGRFHPLQPRSSRMSACGALSFDGLRFLSSHRPPISASGYTGEPGRHFGGCREDVPASTQSPEVRRRLRNVPVCDRREQRIVKFGFAGPRAVRITYGNSRWTRTIRPTKGESGAYIFVLRPHDAEGGGDLTLTATHSDGTICTETRGSGPSGPGCAPPPGIPIG